MVGPVLYKWVSSEGSSVVKQKQWEPWKLPCRPLGGRWEPLGSSPLSQERNASTMSVLKSCLFIKNIVNLRFKTSSFAKLGKFLKSFQEKLQACRQPNVI